MGYMNGIMPFSKSVAVDVFVRKKMRRSKRANNANNILNRLLMRSMAVITIVTTTKDSGIFKQTNDFEIGSISAADNNCATNNVLNDRCLFVG